MKIDWFQKLAECVAMGNVTVFSVFASFDFVFQLLPFSGFDETVCCGVSCSRIRVVESCI